ncbi:MAG TPA: hypothetical protein PLP73_00045 [Candidatus Absconditabacterales bacterium]|nr:hypothetical protein [Candidatus Absconditabacterales bacterium]
MINLNKIFFDKKCDILRIGISDKDGTQIPTKTIVYTNLTCEYYIAPRGNVVNYLPDAEARKTERDRFDCVIPGNLYTHKIMKGDFVVLYDTQGDMEGTYLIDQLTIYTLPNGTVENVYLRLNNENKGDLL